MDSKFPAAAVPLPNHILEKIFFYTNRHHDLRNLRLVSKSWKKFIDSEMLNRPIMAKQLNKDLSLHKWRKKQRSLVSSLTGKKMLDLPAATNCFVLKDYFSAAEPKLHIYRLSSGDYVGHVSLTKEPEDRHFDFINFVEVKHGIFVSLSSCSNELLGYRVKHNSKQQQLESHDFGLKNDVTFMGLHRVSDQKVLVTCLDETLGQIMLINLVDNSKMVIEGSRVGTWHDYFNPRFPSIAVNGRFLAIHWGAKESFLQLLDHVRGVELGTKNVPICPFCSSRVEVTDSYTCLIQNDVDEDDLGCCIVLFFDNNNGCQLNSLYSQRYCTHPDHDYPYMANNRCFAWINWSYETNQPFPCTYDPREGKIKKLKLSRNYEHMSFVKNACSDNFLLLNCSRGYLSKSAVETYDLEKDKSIVVDCNPSRTYLSIMRDNTFLCLSKGDNVIEAVTTYRPYDEEHKPKIYNVDNMFPTAKNLIPSHAKAQILLYASSHMDLRSLRIVSKSWRDFIDQEMLDRPVMVKALDDALQERKRQEKKTLLDVTGSNRYACELVNLSKGTNCFIIGDQTSRKRSEMHVYRNSGEYAGYFRFKAGSDEMPKDTRSFVEIRDDIFASLVATDRMELRGYRLGNRRKRLKTHELDVDIKEKMFLGLQKVSDFRVLLTYVDLKTHQLVIMNLVDNTKTIITDRIGSWSGSHSFRYHSVNFYGHLLAISWEKDNFLQLIDHVRGIELWSQYGVAKRKRSERRVEVTESYTCLIDHVIDPHAEFTKHYSVYFYDNATGKYLNSFSSAIDHWALGSVSTACSSCFVWLSKTSSWKKKPFACTFDPRKGKAKVLNLTENWDSLSIIGNASSDRFLLLRGLIRDDGDTTGKYGLELLDLVEETTALMDSHPDRLYLAKMSDGWIVCFNEDDDAFEAVEVFRPYLTTST